MPTPVVEFFWDAVSPYTYIASTQIDKFQQDTGAKVIWRPFFLGGTFQETGNRPPGMIPAKGKYMFTDLRRVTKKLGIDFWWPKSFPCKTIPVQRMALALETQGLQPAFAKAVMAQHFGKGEDISNDELLDRIITEIGAEPAAIREQIQQDAIKDQLKANTAEMVKRGGFGAPTFFVGEDMFFGHDRMDMLADHIKA